MAIPSEEILSRVERLSALLAEAGLDGMLLTAERQHRLFLRLPSTMHRGPYLPRPFFEVINSSGQAVLIGHTFLTPEMERTSAVRDIRGYSRSRIGSA